MLRKAVGGDESPVRDAIQDALDHALALGDAVTAFDLSRILDEMSFKHVSRARS